MTELLNLVERFDRNREAYCSTNYNETQLRREFVDPFFKALGWDINNEQGDAEAYKDVIHEDSIKIGGVTKTPDYSFRIGGIRKFFLETKKPSVNIKDDAGAAFQLRRYGWSAKLPLSILTNFEWFAVYDCRIKPDKNDKSSTARICYLSYKEYISRWNEIESIFSPTAIRKGSFDKFAESSKGKRGTAEVDVAFLSEIEQWRDWLARNIALRNPELSQRDLNFAVQMTIDRIIFLRICEDRGIERYQQLMEITEHSSIYLSFCNLLYKADEKYNSGLFHFVEEKTSNDAPDTWTMNLKIDDKPLKDIIKGLYYPDSPYEFSVLSVDILGQIYEQFLGKIIRLTPSHRAVIEEKPEVKKAGGVYYTPIHIVEYIIEHTLKELLKDRTPKQVAKLKILDPACGSGSFLIKAYQELLNWHRSWYIKDGVEKHSKELYRGSSNEWQLTTKERKRVLLNNIYGVDIDTQAVEVTKLSLLLKVLEGESGQSLVTQPQLFQERALPNLGNNIKCGNSLIGSDFYDIEQMSIFDDEARYQINTFDWKTEYQAIMEEGGFDVVLGNPPYIFGEQHNQKVKQYFRSNFELAKDQYDTYWLFIEQGLKLTKNQGKFAFIIPDALLAREETKHARAMLLNNGLNRIFHCGTVFKANVSTVVFINNKGEQTNFLLSDLQKENNVFTEHMCNSDRFLADPKYRLLIHMSDQEAAILSKMEKDCKSLGDIIKISRGEEIGKKEVLPEGPIPILVGDDISPYHLKQPSRFVKTITKNSDIYKAPKIVLVKTGQRCIAGLDSAGVVTMQSVYNLHKLSAEISYEAILGLLNSRFVESFIYKTFTAYKHLFPQLNQTTVQSIPIPPNFYKEQASLTDLVQQILSLHEKLVMAKTTHDKTFYQRQISIIDGKINALIYQTYNLNTEEISLIENNVL